MKTTPNGGRQNIKSGISQQPLIRSYSNVKLKLRLQKIEFTNPRYTTFNGRRPQTIKRGISQQPLYVL
jgi:hypothetical protein